MPDFLPLLLQIATSGDCAEILEIIMSMPGTHGCALFTANGDIHASRGHFSSCPAFADKKIFRSDSKTWHFSLPIEQGGLIKGAMSVAGSSLPDSDTESQMIALEIAARLMAPHLPSAKTRQSVQLRGFIGCSPLLRKACEQISIVAPSHSTVLIQGESGTGKELAARAIHENSPNADGPFISLNCAALPASLIESELFGHERGAFTGANQLRRGRFELANGGTLFLDEIGELEAGIQAKLLRALQERSFERLGGMHSISFNARIIAATNRNLAEMVADGSFRRDLFYRLNVFPVHMPPLRERPEDILLLAAHFLEAHKAGVSFSPQAAAILQNHSWPGNARELENIMERAALLLGADSSLLPKHLPEEIQKQDSRSECGAGLEAQLGEIEKTRIIAALSASGGLINKAAPALRMSARQLGLRLQKYNIDYKSFRKKTTCQP